MPQVYAVGEDETWIVAARHPNGDASTSQFYYFPKGQDHRHKNANEIVLGPFSETEFEALREELSLPDRSMRF